MPRTAAKSLLAELEVAAMVPLPEEPVVAESPKLTKAKKPRAPKKAKAVKAEAVEEAPKAPEAKSAEPEPEPKLKRTRKPSTYNILLGEFIKKISLEENEKDKEDRLPRGDRMKKAQDMYREWKVAHAEVAKAEPPKAEESPKTPIAPPKESPKAPPPAPKKGGKKATKATRKA
jgi:hypothetical protein